MKIKATCARCEREVLARQIIDSGGHCPWCGQPFNRDYTAVLVEALRSAEVAGSVLEDALERLEGMDLALELDEKSLLGEQEASIRSINRRRTKA